MLIRAAGRLLAVVFLIAIPASAHHFFGSEYDAAKPVHIAGVVARLDWLNPHIWIYLDVTEPDGKSARWAFSGGAPGQWIRRGLVKTDLKPGTRLVIDGYRAKDGTDTGYTRKITLESGRGFTATGFDADAPNGAPGK